MKTDLQILKMFIENEIPERRSYSATKTYEIILEKIAEIESKCNEIDNDKLFEKLIHIEQKIDEQNILKKDVLTFDDACKYLDISASHLYKLTSQKDIPHYCPRGRKLYFNRAEIDNWLQNK